MIISNMNQNTKNKTNRISKYGFSRKQNQDLIQYTKKQKVNLQNFFIPLKGFIDLPFCIVRLISFQNNSASQIPNSLQIILSSLTFGRSYTFSYRLIIALLFPKTCVIFSRPSPFDSVIFNLSPQYLLSNSDNFTSY